MIKDNRIDYLSKELRHDLDKILSDGVEKGIDVIVQTFVETIMRLERDSFISEFNANNEEFNKGNGYYLRKMAYSLTKYFEVKVPRDRLGEFRPVFLEYANRRREERDNLAFTMYKKGLSTRDIQNIFNDVFGNSYSASQVSLMSKAFEKERDEWLNKKLEKEYYMIYIDGINQKVRRDTVENETFYIVIGVRKDLKREVLGVYNNPVETADVWKENLLDLKRRGLEKVLLVVSDELSGIENVSKEVFKGVKHQLCITHKKRNILNVVRHSDKAEIAGDLKEVFKIGDASYKKEEAEVKLKKFIGKWSKKYPKIGNKLPEGKFEDYFAFLDFPYKIQSMIYTTNWIERLNKSIRKTTKTRNSMPSPNSAMSLISATLMDIEKDNYMKYPVTAFTAVKDVLDEMLRKML